MTRRHPSDGLLGVKGLKVKAVKDHLTSRVEQKPSIIDLRQRIERENKQTR